MFLGNSEEMFENLEASAEALKSSLGFLSVIGDVGLLKPVNTVLFILVSVATSLLAYYIISANYLKVITDNRGAKRTEYQRKNLVGASPVLAVAKKELSLFFSSATYIMNGGIGLVIMIGLSVAALLKKGEVLAVIETLSAEMQMDVGATLLGPIMAVALLLLSSMTMISSSSVSLEGKCLWIIKTVPMTGRQILIAKTLPQLVLSLPATLISGILLSIAFSLSLYDSILAIAVGAVGQLLFAVFGTLINTYFPKFDFENEAQVIKQSMATFIVMMAQMLLSIAFYFVATVLAIFLGSTLALVVMTFILLLILAIISTLLLRPAAKRFESL
jgi:ABC-2 type transport system permease protein